MKLQISRSIAAAVLFGALFAGGAAAQAQTLLKVDVNDRTGADGSTTDSGNQAGFSSYLLPGTTALGSTDGATQTINGYSVNLAPIQTYAAGGGVGTLDDRDRNFSFNAATLTIDQVYDDFVFNNSNTGGIRLTVSGGSLAPNTQYSISVYAYDHGSPAAPNNVPPVSRRTADYTDPNNSNALVLTTNFIGGEVPSDSSNKFTGIARTDANGVLRLIGSNTTAIGSNGLPNSIGVFFNGFEINAITVVPEPTTAVSVMAVAVLGAARRRRA